MATRNIHPDFLFLLEFKETSLVRLYKELRTFILDIYPASNEMLYHTHALTSTYSISDKLADSFCMIPIYTNHLNLGFNKGTLLKDPHQLLTGTGNLIRHIPIETVKDFNNKKVKDLVKASVEFAIRDMDNPTKITGTTISKIKAK
ncbi:DUF1801 domain-containing protein [Pseudoflavitalea rhizosphaerae]|uniref:DUF1801 domain-containing protein n=1 Tax=Pseudoflavitalea rhizosphaerae TaxID=1884793 RepID=UPI000F8D301F|nr:DUF1801 domain-containing protein [Pseudoflavitalea rhizosphaerae]